MCDLVQRLLSQPGLCISSSVFMTSSSLQLLGDWLRGWTTQQRAGGGGDYKGSALLFADTHVDAPPPAALKRIFTQLSLDPDSPPAAMCKGLSSLPTCCLERYLRLQLWSSATVAAFIRGKNVNVSCSSFCSRAKELKARLGSILQKPDWSLSCCKIGKNK